MSQVFSNFAKTVTAATIAEDSTSLGVAPTTGGRFSDLAAGEYELAYLTDGIAFEVIKITQRVNDTLTIERQQESTLPRVWGAGTTIMAGITKGTMESFWKKDDGMASMNLMNYRTLR